MEYNKNIKFSVITVCYNEEKVIRETIESVLNQRWENFEYIIIDGASKDATVEIVSEYAKEDNRIRLYSARDGGIYNAMNKGIQYSQGDFLHFLNARDVFYDYDVLKKVAEVIVDSQADIVIGDIVKKTESGLTKSSYVVGKELLENLKKGVKVCHQAIFASKDSLENGFDEQFKICADYDWLCRQVKANRKIIKIESVVVNFDIHGVSGQAQYLKVGAREGIKIMKNNFPESVSESCNEIEDMLIAVRKNRMLYRYMNQWVAQKQRGTDFSVFFVSQGIYSIAIYGMHYMGQRLYDELQGSQVEIRYAIDRNANRKIEGIPIVVKRPDDDLGAVDAIVITSVFDFLEIKCDLVKKVNCPIISIEEMLFYE